MIFARPRVVLQLFLAIFLVSTTAIAQNTINVPADQPTIQAAINAANPGDTVLVAPGTYVENISFGGKAITVTSSGGAASTIIDGNAAGSVVTFNHGESSGAVLNGFTIQNGRSGYYAGGIEISGASPKITSNTIIGNGGVSGVAIRVNGGSPLIQGNTITNNVQNMGTGGGGALYIGPTSNVSVIGNVISNNHLDGGSSGGGISLYGYASALIQNNYIAGNSAYNGGGGINAQSSATVTIVDNIITNNSSGGGGDGGGFYNDNSGPLVFLNNTLYGNTSPYSGTSEIATYPYYKLNSIFKNNIIYATSGSAVSCSTTNALTATDNIVYSTGTATNGSCAAFSVANGNLAADPLLKDPVNGDFHLQPGSPAIDAGDISNPALPAKDYAGAARLGDDSGQCNFVIDLGVYESHPAAPGALSLSAASLAFSDTVVSSASAPQPLLLTGTGQGCFRITGFNLTGDFSQTNSCGSGVPNGQSCTVQLTFIPTAGGLRTGTLSIPMNTNTGTAPGSVAMSGTGLAPHGTPSPTSLSFPGQNLYTSSAAQTITLTNDGLASLTVTSVSVVGDFTQTNNCGAPIAPGVSCSIQVTFTPTANGQRNGSLSIASNSSPAVAAVSLTGSGLGPQGSFSPASLSFAPQPVNSTSPAQNVVLANVGPLPLNISGFSISGDYAETNNCPGTLATNATCSIQVTFTPTANGQRTGTLSITSNSSPAVANVSLIGSGTASQGNLSPATLSFALQLVNTTSPVQNVVLKNVGSLPLNISGFSISGDYAQTNSCPGALASGASCSIQVTFTPTAVGARPGTLSISSDSAPPIPALAMNGSGAPSTQATINVPADQPTIQAAINAAVDGATVLVAPGTYVENINFAAKAITVTSSGGATSTIIDGNAAGTVVTFNHGESSGAVLNGFTIRNGASQFYGGGIEISGASPNITNNVIANNGGVCGLGIDVDNGSPTIQGNTITDNVQNLGDGGCGGAVQIRGTYGVTSNVRVIGNVITNNHLDGGAFGGGISLSYYASALIQNNYIAGNSAANGGGGISEEAQVPVAIIGNIITGNSSGPGGDGGGVYIQGNGQALLLNNTLYGNVPSYNGTSEIATTPYYSLNATLKNNIIYATSGAAVSCTPINGLIANNNIVYSVSPATDGTCAAFAQSNGNIFFEPGMVDPANGDFHLHVGSPAIDAGVSDPNLPQMDIGGTTRVLDGDNDGTAVVDIGAYEFPQGIAPAGWAVLAPLGATFPITAVGNSTGPINFALLNNGNAPLTVNSIAVNSAFQQANNCPNVLAVRATCLIQVTFAPTANGNFSGTLSVATDGADGTATAPLSGIGNGVFGTLSPASINFGQVTVGSTSSTQSLSLTNTGTAPLVISSVIVTAPFSWATGCSPGTSLAPGASCTMSVIFHPTTLGTATGTLTINSNAAAITPTLVNLSGSGDGPVISVTPASLSFGTIMVGTSSQTQVVTVSNTGDQPLAFYGVQSSSNFVGINNCGTSIAAGGSCSINVTFTPSAAQQYTGTLTLYSNTVVGQTSFPVSASGTGLSPLSASPSSLSFTQRIGTTSAPQIITITNGSSSPLTITNISASSPFAQTNTCPASLAAAASCAISVTFSPSVEGTLSSSVVVQYNGGSTSIPVSGSGVQPIAFLSPNSLSFGQVVVGSSLAKTASLTNSGDAVLNISAINVSGPDFQLQSTSCGATLPSSASCTINITYTPSARGSESGSLTVTHDASGSPSTIPLSGSGIAPVIGISPAMLSFGSVNVGSLSNQTVTVSNTGDAPLTFSSITTAAPFGQSSNCGTSLAANASCTITVTFGPTSSGSASGTLVINHNAAGNPSTVSLSGTGMVAVSLSSSSLGFGNQLVGTTSPAQAITVSNTSDLTVPIQAIAIDSGSVPFAETNNCGTSLAAHTACTINVTFAPNSQGAATSNLSVYLAPAPNQSVALSGTGVAPVASVSPASLTFASQLVGTTSATQTLTLSNTGSAALSISSVATYAPFAQTNNCGTSLAAGASCTINVTFTPTSLGAATANLTINVGAPAANQTVALSGTGIGPSASLSTTSLTFPMQRVGTTSSPQVVTVSNTGSTSLTISSIAANGAIAFAQTNNCPTTLLPGNSCSINVTFAPIQTGTFYGNVTVTDNSGGTSGSTQEVFLTGVAGSATATVSPGSLTFATTAVGTQSSSSSVTLSNSGTMSTNIASIITTGDFIQSNNCASTLPASSSCTINVSFAPSASGTRTGTLTISDDASGGSQTVSLSGSATDFSVVLSPTSVNVNPGQNGNYNAKVSAVGGAYNQTVLLTCSGVPAGATCTLSPTSLIPGSTSQTSKVKINTSNTTPAGTYTIVITGVVNNAVRSGTATLIVK